MGQIQHLYNMVLQSTRPITAVGHPVARPSTPLGSPGVSDPLSDREMRVLSVFETEQLLTSLNCGLDDLLVED
jgi:hypothetical protein